MTTSITLADIARFEHARDAIAAELRAAVALHGERIVAEIETIRAKRAQDPALWARFVVAKAILSPGVKLDPNIRLAVFLRDAIERGETVETYDHAIPYIKAAHYYGRSSGANVNRALNAYHSLKNHSWERAMEWSELTYPGLSLKTRSWALALNDASNRVYTLDTHMLRGFARLAGIDGTSFTITDSAYPKLAALLLDIHDQVCPDYAPLVSQWALWNEYRHPGIHASHLGIVA